MLKWYGCWPQCLCSHPVVNLVGEIAFTTDIVAAHPGLDARFLDPISESDSISDDMDPRATHDRSFHGGMEGMSPRAAQQENLALLSKQDEVWMQVLEQQRVSIVCVLSEIYDVRF
jgi:hypothetical protein